MRIYHSRILQETLDQIVGPVTVTYQAVEQPAAETMAALTDLGRITPHLSVVTEPAASLPADRLTIRNRQGVELVFVGAPLGAELGALVSAIVVAGRQDSGLAAATRRQLAGVTTSVHVEVFTTPT